MLPWDSALGVTLANFTEFTPKIEVEKGRERDNSRA
jgi:hypothetical protein